MSVSVPLSSPVTLFNLSSVVTALLSSKAFHTQSEFTFVNCIFQFAFHTVALAKSGMFYAYCVHQYGDSLSPQEAA
jgi:hypothetical protein